MKKLIMAILAACAAVVGYAETFASYGPYTPGEKVSEAIPALVGYTAKGLPSGLKLNKKTGVISGAAKKPTGDAGVTVTFTKKGAETMTATFVVAPIPTISVTLEGDTEKCKVTGANKAYLVGKKVSLAATGPKGTAFTGWYLNGDPWPNAAEYQTAKIKYVMTAESLDLTATFEREKMAIDTSALEAASLQTGTAVTEGAITVPVSTQSGLKAFTAKGLPSGLKLKLDKVTGVGVLTGTPKKAGTFTVTLKATAKSGAVEQAQAQLVVSANTDSPSANSSWYLGTYSGTGTETVDQGDPEDEWTDKLSVSVTFSKDGRAYGRCRDSEGSASFTMNTTIVSNTASKVILKGNAACGGDEPFEWTWTITPSGVTLFAEIADSTPDVLKATLSKQ